MRLTHDSCRPTVQSVSRIDSAAPLVLARHTIVVAVHCGIRAMLQYVSSFGAGTHLCATRAPATAVLRVGRRRGSGCYGRRWRRRLLQCRCRGEHIDQVIALLIGKRPATERQHHEQGLAKPDLPFCRRRACRIASCRGVVFWRVRTGTHDPHRARTTIRTRLGFERDHFADTWRLGAARKRRNVREHVIARLSRGDEAEAAVGIPAGQRSMCAHWRRP